MKYGYSIPNNATTLAADFTLDWESVNCAEKSQMLDITDFAPENGSGEIITWELDSDEPIRISTFRKGSGLLETNPQKPSYSRYILITLGLLMIAISLVKMYYDRKKRADQ